MKKSAICREGKLQKDDLSLGMHFSVPPDNFFVLALLGLLTSLRLLLSEQQRYKETIQV